MFKKIGIVLLFIVMILGITSTFTIAKAIDKQIALKDLKEDDKKAIKEIIDILKKVKSLEEVGEEDKEKIELYFDIDYEVAVNLEKKGYSLIDSLNISRIINNYGFSVDDIEILLVYNKDIEELEKELAELKQIFILEKISNEYINEFKKLLIDGFSVKEISSAYRIAKPLSVKIERVIKKGNNDESNKKLIEILSKHNEPEAKIIEDISENYFIDIEEVVKICEEQQLNISDMQSKVINSENERNLLYGIDLQTNTTTNTEGGTVKEPDYSKYFNAPFIYEQDKSENVSLSNGSLTYNNIDYILPGRNGLNLEIASRYDSSNSGLYKESSYVEDNSYITTVHGYIAYCIEDIYCISDSGINKLDNEPDKIGFRTIEGAQNLADAYDNQDDYSEIRDDGLIYWHEFSGYVEEGDYETVVVEYTIYSDVTPYPYEEAHNSLGSGWSFGFSSIEINRDSKYLHLGNGQVYKINFTPEQGDSNLDKYTLKDMRIEYESTYFTYSDHIEWSKYVLIYKDGKKEYFSEYGKLLAIKDRYNNTIKFEYCPLLYRITDTLGREVNISYTKTSTGKEIIISLPNNQIIKYVLEAIPGHTNDYILKKKIDQKNRETVFDYEIQEANFSVNTKSCNGAKNYYALLNRITYPTKAQSLYSYEKIRVNMGEEGSTENFRITSRKDIDNNIEYNNETYTYNGNYSGYPAYRNAEFLPGTFTYKTVVTNGSTNITYTFNNKHLLINKQIRDSNLSLLRETSYEYDANKLLIKETETSYGQDASFNQKETLSTYNDYGDRIKYINELGGETYYEYDATYHIPILIYNQADGEIINKTEYSIDPVSGNINWMKKHHFENGIDKSILAEYSYDTYGNLIYEKLIQNDGRIIEKNYEYGLEYNNGYLTKTWTTIKDYENNTHTISELYTYDFNTGNKASNTDARGKNYEYEYDELGRLTKETNPDLTYKTISYDDSSNVTILTNEKPFSLRQQYDGLGRLIKKEEQTDSGWITLEERHYNLHGEVDWTKDTAGNITYYEYDVLGRLIRTTFPDGTFIRTEYIDGQNMKIDYNEEGYGSCYIYDNAGNLKESWNERTDEKNIPRQHKIIYQYDKFGKNRFITDLSTNNTTEYRYDDLGRLTEVVNGLNESTLYEYDNLDKIIKQTTAGGSITERYYDELGRLTQEEDPLQKSEYTAYDANGNIIRKKDRNGTVFSYIYDDLNRLKIVKNDTTAAVIYEYEYDTTGNMTSAKNTQGITSYEYYNDGKLKKEISPDTKYIYYEYYSNGSRSRMTDHFGKETSYTYDLRGRLKTVTVDGKITIYEYYDDGSREYIQYPDGIKEEYYYDENNNLIRLINKKADGTTINEFIYTYDDAGNQKTKQDKNGLTEYTYDILNRVKSVLNPDGTKTKYEYDRNGNIDCEVFSIISSGIESDYTVKDYVYDPAMYRLSSIVSESAKLINLKVSPSDAYLSADQQVFFTLTGTMNGGSTALDSLLNNAVWTCDSDVLTLNTTKGKSVVGLITKSSWDTMSITDVITVRAALEGKIVEARVYKNDVKSLAITPYMVYAYADQEMVFTLTGKMNDGTDISSELLASAIWTTDSDKLALNSSQGTSITCYIPKASWDLMDYEEIIKIRATLGELYFEANIKKVAVGRLTIMPSDVMLVQLRTFTLTLSGEMNDGTVIPDEILNTATWTCSPTGLPLSSTTGKSIEVGSRRNRISDGPFIINATVQGKTTQATVKYYSSTSSSTDLYDDSSSIITVTTDLEEPTLDGEYGDIQDENREDDVLLDFIETGVTNEVIINSEENIILSSTNVDTIFSEESEQNTNITYSESNNPFENITLYYEYDNNGNLIEERVVKTSGEEVTVYGYNELNQLTQLTNLSGTITYTYNPSGLRETKSNGGETTKYYYDGQNVIIEAINNNFSARNIFGINPIVRETSSSKLYYLYNGHADVVAMVDSSGNVINSYDYDIYGNIIEASESGIENPIRYAGQYYDDESDLYYLRARYYDPGLMRFISEDTNRGDVKDPLSLNLYTYCVGNPVNLVDIDGHAPFKYEKDAFGGAFGIGLYCWTMNMAQRLPPDTFEDLLNLVYDLLIGDKQAAAIDMMLLTVDDGINFRMTEEAAKTVTDYKATFFDNNPQLEGKVIVHHGVEQQVLKKYPNLFKEVEIHAYNNLRGIPKEVNSVIHLSKIRMEWNKFYKQVDSGQIPLTKEAFLNKAKEIDKMYGSSFNPKK